jgi:hypothetical protein
VIASARILACCCVCGLAACSDDTGEVRRISMRVQVVGTPSHAVIQTPSGWEVTLAAAEISVAGVYFRNVAPTSGTADDQGRVVAQVLGPFTIDALAEQPEELSVLASALTEPARSAELVLTEAESGPVADALGSASALAHVAGVARRGELSIPFDGGLVLPLTNDSGAYDSWVLRRIRRLAVDFSAQAENVLSLRLDPSHFVDSVAFESLGPEQGTRTFQTKAEQLQLRDGIASPAGYAFGLAD